MQHLINWLNNVNAPAKVKATYTVRYGTSADEIVNSAQEINADLIVMETEGASSFAEELLELIQGRYLIWYTKIIQKPASRQCFINGHTDIRKGLDYFLLQKHADLLVTVNLPEKFLRADNE